MMQNRRRVSNALFKELGYDQITEVIELRDRRKVNDILHEWRVHEDRLQVRKVEGWVNARSNEVTLEVSKSAAKLRASTGLRFSKTLQSPKVLVQGRLPDDVYIELAIVRANRRITIPDNIADSTIHAGRWYPLDPVAMEACKEFLGRNGIEESSKIPLGTYLKVTSDPLAGNFVIDSTEQPELQELSSPGKDFSELGLAIDLFPYQKVGAEFLTMMANRGVGVLLADQMGLGKTAQAIALILEQREKGAALVVCPASLARNWTREIEQFAPNLSVLNHAGPLRSGVIDGITKHDVVVVSYETLVNDSSLFLDGFWNLMIIDEAQSIRNPEAIRSSVVKEMHRNVSVAVTGTPVENRLLDLWSIIEFVIPSLLESRELFEETYPDEFDRAEALGRAVAPVTLRRLVADVATDLPDLIEVVTPFAMSEKDLSRHEQIIDESVSPLAATTALRVLCAHGDIDKTNDFGIIPPKIDHANRLISEIFNENQKVLVFASFKKSLDILHAATKRGHPGSFLEIIDGRVPVSERQHIIDAFGEHSGPGALFLNPQAAGVGLNITAANHVIHFNPEWNPALTSQATARAYRRRQTLPVTVHHFYYEGTVEEDALIVAQKKGFLAGYVDEGAATLNGSE